MIWPSRGEGGRERIWPSRAEGFIACMTKHLPPLCLSLSFPLFFFRHHLVLHVHSLVSPRPHASSSRKRRRRRSGSGRQKTEEIERQTPNIIDKSVRQEKTPRGSAFHLVSVSFSSSPLPSPPLSCPTLSPSSSIASHVSVCLSSQTTLTKPVSYTLLHFQSCLLILRLFLLSVTFTSL